METSGHSIANPRVLAESGIEAVFMLHIEQEDRKLRLQDKSMEFVWRPMYDHLGRRAEVFGHVFYDFFTSPLDILTEDFKPSFDPTQGHVKPGPPKPWVPPPHYQGEVPDRQLKQSQELNETNSHLRTYI
jgi:Glycosyl hydrolases family 38 N-terminal domain